MPEVATVSERVYRSLRLPPVRGEVRHPAPAEHIQVSPLSVQASRMPIDCADVCNVPRLGRGALKRFAAECGVARRILDRAASSNANGVFYLR